MDPNQNAIVVMAAEAASHCFCKHFPRLVDAVAEGATRRGKALDKIAASVKAIEKHADSIADALVEIRMIVEGKG